MKIYKANGNSSLSVGNIEPEETKKVKIKVTQIMPSLSDVKLFTGETKQNYPFILGHSAIGAVSDDRPEYGLKRGTKVILNPYITSVSDRLDMPGKVKTLGVDINGFFRDFVYMDIDEFVPFPDGVEESEALFTEKIAIAMAAINSFRVEKGDYIAVIGEGPISNIIAQLALYFQLIPIVIDSDDGRLERASQNGVYFTINSSEEVVYDRVKEITGGRMCEHTVVEASASISDSYLFNFARFGGDCVIISENNAVSEFNANVSAVAKNQIRVKGVAVGASEFDSAVNILAQQILNMDGFIEKRVSIDDAEELLKEIDAEPNAYYATAVKL